MTEILLVDDERTIRDSLSRLLREAGFTVLIAANGAAAEPRYARPYGFEGVSSSLLKPMRRRGGSCGAESC